MTLRQQVVRGLRIRDDNDTASARRRSKAFFSRVNRFSPYTASHENRSSKIDHTLFVAKYVEQDQFIYFYMYSTVYFFNIMVKYTSSRISLKAERNKAAQANLYTVQSKANSSFLSCLNHPSVCII
jgi:hypothetical protein